MRAFIFRLILSMPIVRTAALLSFLCAALPAFSQATPAADKDAVLPEVVVSGAHEKKSAPKQSSNVEAGYRSTTASVGPLGQISLADTPYTISVMPAQLIEDTQSSNATDALKLVPTVNPEMGSNRTGDYLSIRGFINSGNQALDGMRVEMSNGSYLEDKERIEIISGADSFLYGIASPAGMVNYILKRPTAERLFKMTVGDYGGTQAYMHIDASGPFDRKKKFGYRVNLLGVDQGDTAVTHESHKRTLSSGAADWHITPGTMLAFDGSYYHRDLEYMQAFFKLGSATKVPDAPEASRNYAAPYAGTEGTKSTFGLLLTSTLADATTANAAFRYSRVVSNGFRSMRDVWLDNSGSYYQQMMYYSGQDKEETIQGHGFVNSQFKTGQVQHRISAGYVIDHVPDTSTSDAGSVTYSFPKTTIFTLSNPGYSAYPSNISITKNAPYIPIETVTRQSAIFADQVLFNAHWSALAGGAYARVKDTDYPADTGSGTTLYEKGQWTPSLALMYKPLPEVTTYVSYIEALSEGPTAPDTASNAGRTLAPYVSNQVEAGIKAIAGKMNINAAFYRINEANAYTDATTLLYSEDGREVHTGAELSFTGKATRDLTLLGGFSILHAAINKTSTASLQGKMPQAVPEAMARVYADYAVPVVRGLSLTAGIYYTGREWVNDANTISIPRIVPGDMGARYQHKLMGKVTAFRLNVNNVTNENYWTTKGGSMLYLGSPRTLVSSMTVNF